jgi:hypothetical protein
MTGQEKLDTCKFRSREKHVTQETWCCGRRPKEGYLCFQMIGIDNITAEICEHCVMYENKEQNG